MVTVAAGAYPSRADVGPPLPRGSPGRPTAAWNGGEVMARERGGASGQAPGVFRRVFGRRRGAAESEPATPEPVALQPPAQQPEPAPPAAERERDVPSLPPATPRE